MPAHRVISDEDVVALRTNWVAWRSRELAKQYGISISYAMALAYYRNRKSVGPPRETVTYYIPEYEPHLNKPKAIIR